MRNLVYNFFVDDIRKNAPREAELPSREDIIRAQLWDGILIECHYDQFNVSSATNRNLAYRVPLNTPAERERGADIICRIGSRIARLGCVKRAAWKIHSTPNVEEDAVFYFWSSLNCVAKTEVDIPAQGGSLPLRMAGSVYRYFSAQLDLNIRNGELCSRGTAFGALKALRKVCPRYWPKAFNLRVSISKITPKGRKLLETVSPAIEWVTIDEIREEAVLDEIMLLVRNTRIKELNINRIDIPGKVHISLPRGSMSFSIASVSSSTIVHLRCSVQLEALTITKKVVGRIVGPRLRVKRLRVMGMVDTATFDRLKSRFAEAIALDEILMAPRLGTAKGHDVWVLAHGRRVLNGGIVPCMSCWPDQYREFTELDPDKMEFAAGCS